MRTMRNAEADGWFLRDRRIPHAHSRGQICTLMWDRMWDRLASRSHNASVCWAERRMFGAGEGQRTGLVKLCPRSAVRSRPRGMTGRERAARTRTSTALRRIAVLSGERRAIIIRSARRDVCARVLPPAPSPKVGKAGVRNGRQGRGPATPCVARIAVSCPGATRRRFNSRPT